MTQDRSFPLRRPKLKDVFGAFFLDRRIRMGQGYGYAFEIEDPEGHYAALVRRLDGSSDVATLIRDMAPSMDEAEVLEGLEGLLEAGCLEDAATEPPPSLSPARLERYRANLHFFNTLARHPETKFDYQAKLASTSVVLLGLGGIGSNVCTALAELGVGRVTAVDFDRVELANLNRQVLYSTRAVGRPKVEVAAERIRDFNPEMEFVGIDLRISSAQDVADVLDSNPCDFVINLADRPNGYIDHWVNEACVRRRLPIAAAVIFHVIGTAYSVVPGRSACYECRVSAELERHGRLREEIGYIREKDVWAVNGALGPACMFQSYFLTHEFMRYLFGMPMLTWNRTLEIDFLSFEQTYHEFERSPDGPVCSQVPVG